MSVISWSKLHIAPLYFVVSKSRMFQPRWTRYCFIVPTKIFITFITRHIKQYGISFTYRVVVIVSLQKKQGVSNSFPRGYGNVECENHLSPRNRMKGCLRRWCVIGVAVQPQTADNSKCTYAVRLATSQNSLNIYFTHLNNLLSFTFFCRSIMLFHNS